MNVHAIKDFYDFLREKWNEPIGLFVAYGACITCTFWLTDLVLKGSTVAWIQSNFWHIQLGGALLLVALTTVAWLLGRRYPKRHEGKIGIAISIRDDSPEIKKIRNEVIERFGEIIKETSVGSLIEIVPIANFRAKHVTDEVSATRLSNKTRSQFVVYGRIVNIAGKVEFNLHYIVRHIPLAPKGLELVKRGFAEALVNKSWLFLESDTIAGIKVTAHNVREICLYVTGIAAHLSRDFSVSMKLHEDLKTILDADAEKRSEFGPVLQRLPYWLSESYLALALIEYFQNKNLPQAKALNEKSLTYQPENNNATLNQALFLFEEGDVPGAKRQIKMLRRRNARGNLPDSAWRYSEAFLAFYEDKYDAGLKAYKKGFVGYTHPATVEGIISYLENYTEKHPEKIQFTFALAHVLVKKESNYTRALEHLERFLNNPSSNEQKYVLFKRLAENYLQDAKSIIGLQS